MSAGSGSRVTEALFRLFVPVRSTPEDTATIAADVRDRVAANGLRQVAAQSLQSAGEQVVNAKTVLPWLASTLSVPLVFLGLLVPIRESGSILPQVAMTSYLRRLRHRKYAWALGAVGQALAAMAMGLVAATARGWVAGTMLLGALVVFALARSLCSLASKDVLGRTVPPGQRGQINGAVTVLSGFVALTLGLALRWQGEDLNESLIAWLLTGAGGAWLLAAVVYAGVREPAGEQKVAADAGHWLHDALRLVRADRTFARFVTVRSLLLVSALSPPFVVSLGVSAGGDGLGGLGLFVLAQGVASLVGGSFFGRLADRSSRRLRVWCAIAASALILGFLMLWGFTGARTAAWLYPGTYLLLTLVHVGTRVARKTYVVDIAEGDQRTEYVAVSNAIIGVVLLMVGAVTAMLASWGPSWALLLLAALGLLGALLGRGLPDAAGADFPRASPAR